MSEKVSVKGGRNLVVGGISFEVRDREIPVSYVDLVCEANQWNGMVHLAVGASYTEFDNGPCVDVVTRMRMTLVTAQNIHATLGNMIADAQRPVKKSKVN